MEYLFLGLFIIFTILHLWASFHDDKKYRSYTKPFLISFLLLYYLFSTKNINIYLVLALFTSWLGDVLLIPKGHKWFTIGGISFMFAHLFFILVYKDNIVFNNWLLLILLLIIYISISYKTYSMIKPTTPKKMIHVMFFYLICNSLMNIFAFIQFNTLLNIGSLLAYIGAILFFISDNVLFLVRYYKNENYIFKKHFPVMLTYLIGEFLIVQGLLMI